MATHSSDSSTAQTTGGRTTGFIPGDPQPSRTFACPACGAEINFNIQAQTLKCDYCGMVKPIDTTGAVAVEERDYALMLEQLAEWRARGTPEDAQEFSEVRCSSCGATVRFSGTLTSGDCAYCGAPIQRQHVHDATQRIPVDGVLPFEVDRRQAQQHLSAWVRSRWFAPGAFTAAGAEGKFNGIYLPYWTYDAATATAYRGQRGEHYWETVGSGKNRRQVLRTRWYPASGSFPRFFDDVLVPAASGIPEQRVVALEPWPVARCRGYAPELLAGFLARTYDVPLERGFAIARGRIDAALEQDVRLHIGGDTQRIEAVDTRYNAITYKHLLLPVWMLAYRYGQRSYQVVVNAGTGEVQGDRPYSWIKIAGAVLGGLALLAAAALVAGLTH